MPNLKQILDQLRDAARDSTQAAEAAGDIIRRGYLERLHKHTKNNVIAYYSGFLSKPDIGGADINHEDTNGFMATVHGLDRTKPLDLILHTPGGGISATMAIVKYVRSMFPAGIRAIVPQIAMSAGTMIACSCDKILMSKHSVLGPTDPQFGGIAAAGVRDEFKQACDEVKADPSRIPVWQSIIGQYPPTFLSQCDNAVVQASEFVEEQLIANMFKKDPRRKAKARAIVKTLTDYTGNKSHDRPIPIGECRKMGLDVETIESDPAFQDLVLSAHHCYMFAFMNGPAFKIIENHRGVALVKQQVQMLKRVH